MSSKSIYVRATTLDLLAVEGSKKVFNSALNSELGLQALQRKAQTEGFKPVRGKQSNWGMKASWTLSNGQSTTYEMHVESHRRDSDEGCLMTESLRTSDGKTVVSHSFLVAPKGNFNKVTEYYADSVNRVRLAHSKWTRFKKCVRARCVGPCLASLGTCVGTTWAVYLACVAVACGGCMAICGACALCNCSVWCKWGVGCCKD